MTTIKPQTAREHFARHVRGCGTCDAREAGTGALCLIGELLARALAMAVMRRGGGRI